jgi:hypothetical protein
MLGRADAPNGLVWASFLGLSIDSGFVQAAIDWDDLIYGKSSGAYPISKWDEI